MNPSLKSIQPYETPSQSGFGLRTIFVGRSGLQAGWRVLIFAVMVLTLLASFVIIRNGGVEGFREARKNAGQVAVTPWLMIKSELGAFALVCLAAIIMAKVEKRKFGVYGLSLHRRLGREFGIGWLAGFLALSATLLGIFALHGFRITGLALHGTAIVSAIALWAAAFLLAGLFEEFLCRGYLQYTLASGMGFWPAAFLMSGMFAFGHIFNSRETPAGVLSVVGFGLLFCLFLRRTGTLWLAVGFHAAWDFGQTFYGVPDSGMLPYHNVFQSAFSGPLWLTGGVVGPEASVFTPLALLIVALIFSRFCRENRYQVGQLT